MSSYVTGDEQYKQRLQLHAEVWSPDWTENIFTFNQSENLNSPLQIISAKVSNSIDSYGTFDLFVRDTHSILKDKLVDNGYIVKFKGKRPYQTSFDNIQSSIVRKIERLYTSGADERLYKISGVGVGSILTHTIINYSLQSAYKNVTIGTNNTDKNDPNMLAPQHVRRVFTDRKVLPALAQGLTVQERGNFGLGKINDNINTYINSIDVYGTTPNALCRDIANSCSCIFTIDEDNDVLFDRPMNRTLGHYITNNSDDMNRNANTTIMTSEQVSDVASTYAEDGYFDKLYAYSQQSTVSSANTDMGGYTPLYRNDVAYRVPQAGASQFWDMSFMLQKFGVGTDSDDPSNTFLHGLIVSDDGGLIGRNSEIVGEFVIPVEFIKTTVSWINRFNIRFRKDIQVDKAYWIVLKKIGDSPDDTIGWWHDGITNQKGVYSAYRFSRGVSDTPSNVGTGWTYSSTGPKYTYTYSQRTPTLQSSLGVNFNPKYKTIAPVEKFETVNWIKSPDASMQYLAYITQLASRAKHTFDLGRCSVPIVLPRIGYANVLELSQTVNGETDTNSYIFNTSEISYDFEITGCRWIEIKGDTYDLNIENVIEEDEDELIYVCID